MWGQCQVSRAPSHTWTYQTRSAVAMTFLHRFTNAFKATTYKTASDKLVRVPTVRLQQRRQRTSSPACRRLTKPLIVWMQRTTERVASNSLGLAQFEIGDVKRKETTWQTVTLQNRNPAPLTELLTSPDTPE